MDLKVRSKNDIYLVDIEGPELDHKNSSLFNDGIIKLVQQEEIKFIALNMINVNWITSSGVGTLLNIKKFLNISEGELCLYNITEQVSDSIRVLMIDRIMPVLSSEEEALKYLQEYNDLKTKLVFDVNVENDVAIVEILDKQLDLQNAGELESICSNLIEKNKIKNIVLNFSQATFITSSGIGAILSVFNCANNNDSKFVIFGLNQDILESLEISMVDKILNIENSKEDALNFIKSM